MQTEPELLALLKTTLKCRVVDPEAYMKTIRGKGLRSEFAKLLVLAKDHDELWEYEWWGPTEPRNRYDLGWCVVRAGEPIAYYSHSSS